MIKKVRSMEEGMKNKETGKNNCVGEEKLGLGKKKWRCKKKMEKGKEKLRRGRKNGGGEEKIRKLGLKIKPCFSNCRPFKNPLQKERTEKEEKLRSQLKSKGFNTPDFVSNVVSWGANFES